MSNLYAEYYEAVFAFIEGYLDTEIPVKTLQYMTIDLIEHRRLAEIAKHKLKPLRSMAKRLPLNVQYYAIHHRNSCLLPHIRKLVFLPIEYSDGSKDSYKEIIKEIIKFSITLCKRATGDRFITRGVILGEGGMLGEDERRAFAKKIAPAFQKDKNLPFAFLEVIVEELGYLNKEFLSKTGPLSLRLLFGVLEPLLDELGILPKGISSKNFIDSFKSEVISHRVNSIKLNVPVQQYIQSRYKTKRITKTDLKEFIICFDGAGVHTSYYGVVKQTDGIDLDFKGAKDTRSVEFAECVSTFTGSVKAPTELVVLLDELLRYEGINGKDVPCLWGRYVTWNYPDDKTHIFFVRLVNIFLVIERFLLLTKAPGLPTPVQYFSALLKMNKMKRFSYFKYAILLFLSKHFDKLDSQMKKKTKRIFNSLYIKMNRPGGIPDIYKGLITTTAKSLATNVNSIS